MGTDNTYFSLIIIILMEASFYEQAKCGMKPSLEFLEAS